MSIITDKIKKTNQLFQKENISDYRNTAEKLKEITDAEITIADAKNNIIASSKKDGQNAELSEQYKEMAKARQEARKQLSEDTFCLSVPVICHKQYLGIIFAEQKEQVEEESIIIENAAVLIGIHLYNESQKNMQQKKSAINKIEAALKNLTYTETRASIYIFREFKNKDKGIITASIIADKAKITRSVIVNTFRKLESAGLIETKSLGMKGTLIKILNPLFMQELKTAADKIDIEF